MQRGGALIAGPGSPTAEQLWCRVLPYCWRVLYPVGCMQELDCVYVCAAPSVEWAVGGLPAHCFGWVAIAGLQALTQPAFLGSFAAPLVAATWCLACMPGLFWSLGMWTVCSCCVTRFHLHSFACLKRCACVLACAWAELSCALRGWALVNGWKLDDTADGAVTPRYASPPRLSCPWGLQALQSASLGSLSLNLMLTCRYCLLYAVSYNMMFPPHLCHGELHCTASCAARLFRRHLNGRVNCTLER